MAIKIPGKLSTPHGFNQETCVVCLEGSHRHWFRRFGKDKEHCSCDHHTASDYLARAEDLIAQGERELAEEFRRFAHWLDKDADKRDKPVCLGIRQTS